MSTKNRFRKERYIWQKCTNGRWSFVVRHKGIIKTFNEKDFLSAHQAFSAAVEYRNSIMVYANALPTEVTVDDCFNSIDEIYVLRSETRRKIQIYYKYIKKKDTPITEITKTDIISDLNSMVETHSNDYIRRVLSIWNKIFGVALAKGYCVYDTSSDIKAPTSHKLKAKKRNEITDKETLDTLAKHLEKALQFPYERKQARNILFILYYTGMRPAEMFALDKKDIDLKKRQISINKELGSDRDKENVIRPCKTELSHRVIPISDSCLPFIKSAMDMYETSALFVGRKGNYFNPSHLGDKYHKLAAKIGIDFHFYQCRHTFITNLFMKGVDLKTIQELVGQKIDSTTIGYVVSNKELQKNAVNLL